MKLNRNIIITSTVWSLILAAALYVQPEYMIEKEATIDILRVQKSITAGQTITSEFIDVESIPVSALVEGAYTQETEVSGKIALHALNVKDQITNLDILPETQNEKITKSIRISVSTIAAKEIAKLDYIDINVRFNQLQMERDQAQRVLCKLQVQDIKDSAGMSLNASSVTAPEFAIFYLTPEEDSIIENALAEGELYFTKYNNPNAEAHTPNYDPYFKKLYHPEEVIVPEDESEEIEGEAEILESNGTDSKPE